MTDRRITHISTHSLQVPWQSGAPNNGIMPPTHREFLVLQLTSADGITGMGYLQPLAGGLETLQACIKELIAPRLLGRDATDIEAIWNDLWSATYWLGRGGVTTFAMSAVDIALWDRLGNETGLALHRLWGHCHDKVPAYGSGCWRGLGRDGMIERARYFTQMGLNAIKMQVAHIRPWREDVRNVHAMREAMGANIEIMIDVNMGWDAATAIQAGHHFDEADVYWLEEPVVCEDYAGYQRVAQALRTRVVGGESHFTRFELRPFFDHPSSPILQPDPMRGGLTELRKIAAIADTVGIHIAPHLFHELNVHVLASIANANYAEYMDWNDDLWVDPLVPVDGALLVPERPGHGIAFKSEILSDACVAHWQQSNKVAITGARVTAT